MIKLGDMFVSRNLILGCLICVSSSLIARTFTDTDGRQFDGSLLSVAGGQVAVQRNLDRQNFTLERTRFSDSDQVYFDDWIEQNSIGKLSYRLREGESIRALPRQLRVDLIWVPSGLPHYEVQRSESIDGPWITLENRTPEFHVFSDYIGEPDVEYFYRVRNVRLNRQGHVAEVAPWSEVVHARTCAFDLDRLLGEVQEAGVRFFFEQAHPVSGLAPEGAPGWGGVRATGASGMGMANIIVGVHRGFVSRTEGAALAVKMLRFLHDETETHKGAFGHWMDGASGVIRPFGEPGRSVDLVETAFVIQGAILLREYFAADNPTEREIRKIASSLSASVEWNEFIVQRGNRKVMMWHWHPQDGFSDLGIYGFHEAMMPYILGIGSTTSPIPVDSFSTGWMHPVHGLGSERTHFNIQHTLGDGVGWPLFFAHYSHIGFDPKAITYRGLTYQKHFEAATRVHEAYALSRAHEFKGYGQVWGLAASLSPDGYGAWHPGKHDNGTIATTASLSSLPYYPEGVLKCLKHMYLDYGQDIWGPYGFYNAFNPTRDWVATCYIGIELGPIAPMIENYRSGLLWRLFMQAPEVRRVIERLKSVPPF